MYTYRKTVKTGEKYVQDALTELKICLSEDPNCCEKKEALAKLVLTTESEEGC